MWKPKKMDVTMQRRQGLINFIGAAMHTLLRVYDNECIQKTNEIIEKSEVNGANILHIMKTQTTVMKITIKNLGKAH